MTDTFSRFAVRRIMGFLINRYDSERDDVKDKIENIDVTKELGYAFGDMLSYYRITGEFPTGREKRDESGRTKQETK